MKKYIIFIIPLFFIGCINKQGISLKYYPECKEYYDYFGIYHKKCEENIIKFQNSINKQQQINPFRLNNCLNCK